MSAHWIALLSGGASTIAAYVVMLFRSDRVSTLYRELALVLDHGTAAEAAAAVICHLAVLLRAKSTASRR